MTDNTAAALQLFTTLDARTAERFKIVHEDARRDRREILGQIEGIGRELRAGFAAVDVRLADVCDRRGVEHGAMTTDIEELRDRMDAKDHQAEGRRQITRPVLGLLKEHGVLLGFLAFGTWTVADDIVPLVVANSSAAASVNVLARSEPPPKPTDAYYPSATAQIPPADPAIPLRGF